MPIISPIEPDRRGCCFYVATTKPAIVVVVLMGHSKHSYDYERFCDNQLPRNVPLWNGFGMEWLGLDLDFA